MSLTSKERMDQLEAWLNTPEVKNKKLHVIVHVGTNNLFDTIKFSLFFFSIKNLLFIKKKSLAKHAAKFENVKGIAVTPPCYFKPKDEDVVA